MLCDVMRLREIPFASYGPGPESSPRCGKPSVRLAWSPCRSMRSSPEQAGLVVETTTDLTESTLPTFERWRTRTLKRIETNRTGAGHGRMKAFIRSTDILESLWRERTLGYGLFSARRPVSLPQKEQ